MKKIILLGLIGFLLVYSWLPEFQSAPEDFVVVTAVPETQTVVDVIPEPEPETISVLAEVQIPELKCGEHKVCKQIDSCKAAKFYLNTCGFKNLDLDKDGVPCEGSKCPNK